MELAQKVRDLTRYAEKHAMTIAVMGCRVNGPGETDDADLGLWCGPKFVNLKKGTETLGAFSYEEILPRLKAELDRLIEEKGDRNTRFKSATDKLKINVNRKSMRRKK